MAQTQTGPGTTPSTSYQKKQPGVRARILTILAAILVCLALMYFPIPERLRAVRGSLLDPRGQKALGVLIFALILWIFEALPFHVTGLLSILALSLVGAGDFQAIIRKGFGDDVVVFFIGVLALAAAIVRSGLGKRISLLVLSITGNSTRRIIFGFLVAGAVLSMWVTAMAASAIVMPLALGILKEEGSVPGKSQFGRGLMIAVAWGALIGAVGTPAGSGSNPLVVKFLGTLAHLDISFTSWMALGIPMLLLLLPAGWALILLFFPPEMKHLKKSNEEIRKEFSEQNPMSRDEKATLVVFCLTIAVWLFSPLIQEIAHIKIPISMAALGALVLLFAPGVTSFRWKEIEKEIDWSGIILIATGISLGMTLYESGAAGWLSALILGGIGSVPLFFQFVLIALGVLAVKIAFSSNTLTGTIIVPLVLALSTQLGPEATALAFAAGFTANLAVILVTTSPVNIIPYTTGYFTIADMAKAGLAFAPVIALVIALVFSTVGRLMGIV